MPNPIREVIHTVMEVCPSLPVSRRIALCRGLAEICGDPVEAAGFLREAAVLDSAELLHKELSLQFKQPTEGAQA